MKEFSTILESLPPPNSPEECLARIRQLEDLKRALTVFQLTETTSSWLSRPDPEAG